jgi:hypothetical protein
MTVDITEQFAAAPITIEDAVPLLKRQLINPVIPLPFAINPLRLKGKLIIEQSDILNPPVPEVEKLLPHKQLNITTTPAELLLTPGFAVVKNPLLLIVIEPGEVISHAANPATVMANVELCAFNAELALELEKLNPV